MVSRRSLAFLLALSACDESRGEGSLDGGGSAQQVDGNDGGPGEDSRGDGDSDTDEDGYQVRLQTTAPEICAGECTTLTVQVDHGVAPYRYAWQPEHAGESAATVEVCPIQTTRYEVTVTDSAGATGEFGGDAHQATASVDVNVRTGCNPAATLCTARIPFTHPNGLSANSGVESQAEIATDSHGNLIMVGSFTGSINFGGGVLKSTSYADAFVLKLGPRCEFLWVKSLGNAAAQIGHATVAVTPDDQMFVTGSFSGTLNFGDQSRTATKQAAYVLKLDEEGNVLWSRSYASAGYDSWATDVGVTAEGDVVFGGTTGPDTNFGGGAIGGDVYSSIGGAYVASLSADGAHRFSHPLRKTSPGVPIAVQGSGRVVLSGMGMEPTVQVDSGSVAVSDPGGGRYLVMLDDAGDFSWGKPLSRTPPPGGRVTATINGGASIVFAPDNSLVADQGPLSVEDANGYIADPQRLVKVGSPGTELEFAL